MNQHSLNELEAAMLKNDYSSFVLRERRESQRMVSATTSSSRWKITGRFVQLSRTFML